MNQAALTRLQSRGLRIPGLHVIRGRDELPPLMPPQPTSGEPGAICPCILVPELLILMGAEHAARMHKKGPKGAQIAWSVADHRYHIGDEEKHYFPLMLRVADTLDAAGCPACLDEAAGIRHAIARLGREHGELRRNYLDRDMVPPASAIRKHGIAEDMLIVRFEKQIREEMKEAA